MTPQETRALYNRMRAFSKDHQIVMVTAKQHPRPEGYSVPPPIETDVIIVDYISLLPRSDT